jgi:SAM-dependent methyltransferase
MERQAFEQFERLERDHWWFRGRRRVYLGLLEHVLAGTRPAAALDLGTGVGGFLPGLARFAGRVVPVDADAGALAVCARRELPVNVARPLRAGSAPLPFADASFDLVALFDVLEHLDDDRACLDEVRRLLRPGGRVIASVPACPWLWSSNDRVSGHRRRYTRRSLRAAFEASGLELERLTHANVLLFLPIVLATLCAQLWEATLGRGASHTNLSWPLPRALHALCYVAFAAELPLARRFDLPLGHSLVAVARRRA